VPPDQLVIEPALSCGCNAREGDALKGDFPNSISLEVGKSCDMYGVGNVALTSCFVASRIPGRLSWWRATHSNCPSEGCDVAVEEPEAMALSTSEGRCPAACTGPRSGTSTVPSSLTVRTLPAFCPGSRTMDGPSASETATSAMPPSRRLERGVLGGRLVRSIGASRRRAGQGAAHRGQRQHPIESVP